MTPDSGQYALVASRGRSVAIGCLVLVLGGILASCGGESGARDTAEIATDVGCSGARYRPAVMPTAVQEMECSSRYFDRPLIIDRWAKNAYAKDALTRADAWCALSPSLGSRSISLVYHRNWAVVTASSKSADVIHQQWASSRRDVRCCGIAPCPAQSVWRWWYWLAITVVALVVALAAWRSGTTRARRRRRAVAVRAYEAQARW
jgi:hypothetical protein